MPGVWTVLCESPELALDIRRDAARVDLQIAPEVVEAPLAEAHGWLDAQRPLALVTHSPVEPDALLRLADAADRAGRTLPIGLVGTDGRMRALAHDLGLAALAETGALAAAMALLEVRAPKPWAATTKELAAADRVRLGDRVGHDKSGRLLRGEDGLIAHQDEEGHLRPLGVPADVGSAMHALRASEDHGRPRVPSVEGVTRQGVLEVILGPPRALSDPASKAALAHYDVPLPEEELCTTPSRTASEAARIGFPVRIALASPDLRIWDHPELCAHDVTSAAAARETYRQLLALAHTGHPQARVLGVTVSASTAARALLRVTMKPGEGGVAIAEIGFADAHGQAADDATLTVLPATPKALERTLGRLAGSELLLRGNASERKLAVSQIGDVLLRLAAFLHDWRDEIAELEVDPLALLVGGELEVREVCIRVGDAFRQSMLARGR